MEKPIYLTTKRLIYNIAKVDFRNNIISEQELNKRKLDWELEYNNKSLQKELKKKYEKNTN